VRGGAARRAPVEVAFLERAAGNPHAHAAAILAAYAVEGGRGDPLIPGFQRVLRTPRFQNGAAGVDDAGAAPQYVGRLIRVVADVATFQLTPRLPAMLPAASAVRAAHRARSPRPNCPSSGDLLWASAAVPPPCDVAHRARFR
jgi:hypothetical protein